MWIKSEDYDSRILCVIEITHMVKLKDFTIRLVCTLVKNSVVQLDMLHFRTRIGDDCENYGRMELLMFFADSEPWTEGCDHGSS